MRMFTKILQVSCLISGLLACTGPSRERSQQIPPQKLPISYTPMELDSLYEPLYQDSFIFLEFTWRVKDDTLITVWYVRESDTLRTLDRYIYSEHAEF